jgi:hypothetical protein
VNERVQCEFSLVRYVPDPVKNEFVNIGVMLREAATDAEAALRFTKDWARVRCVDPDADIEMLEAMETEMRRRLLDDDTETTPLMTTIRDSFSHQLQMTEPKACLAENVAAGMDELMHLYVEPRTHKARQSLSGRQAIVRSMRMRAGLGPDAEADCGVGLYAARRFAEDRLWLPAQRNNSDVSCRLACRGRGAGEGTGIQRTGAQDGCDEGGERGTGVDGDRGTAAQR